MQNRLQKGGAEGDPETCQRVETQKAAEASAEAEKDSSRFQMASPHTRVCGLVAHLASAAFACGSFSPHAVVGLYGVVPPSEGLGALSCTVPGIRQSWMGALLVSGSRNNSEEN